MDISDFICKWIHISHNNFLFGNEDLIKNNQLDFKTLITLALPSDRGDFKEGNFEIAYKGKTINIQISKILGKAQDPIFSSISNDELIGRFHEDITKIHLPLEMYTDNRGNYPYYCARINFPYRLAQWVNENNDYEREQITGGHKDEDKVEAIFALNKLFQNGHYRLHKRLVYEDVTLFTEDYLLKQNSQLLFRRIVPFASESALKDAICSFLGSGCNNYITEIVEKQSHSGIYPTIRTETDLLEFIVHNIENNIIHYIENQYLIQAFWNTRDKGSPHDKTKNERDKPKIETDIQPTLHFLLQLSLLCSRGIHVVREPDEGIGKLDFKFLYTTPDGEPLLICLEFKLAHNKEIEHGVTRQLPSYMKANKSTSGIFAVMWFKDEDGNVFKEPKNRTKTGMTEYIREKAKETNEKEGLNIRTLFIDASVRKPASKL